MRFRESFIFQNAVTAIGNGNEYSIGLIDDLTIEITGTSTSRTIIFEGKGSSGAWYPISCVKLNGYEIATQTTGNNELWSVELEGIVGFRARVANISGGNVSVNSVITG
jgi:hypothetical protein